MPVNSFLNLLLYEPGPWHTGLPGTLPARHLHNKLSSCKFTAVTGKIKGGDIGKLGMFVLI